MKTSQDTSDRAQQSARGRMVERLAWVTGRAGTWSDRAEWVLLALAAAAFAAATVWAWRALPTGLQAPEPGSLALAGVLGVVTVAMTAAEFHVAARMLGHPVRSSESMRVSVLGSAANLLPLPGAAAVRLRALRQRGIPTRTVFVVLLAVGIAWVATAALVAGLWVFVADGNHAVTAAAFALAAAMGAAAVAVLLRSAAGPSVARHVPAMVAVHLVSVVNSGSRLYAVGLAAGFDVTFPKTMAINLGAILSHVAGIVPGGLGVREVLSGAMGSAVGVAAGVGVLVAVVDRLVLYVVLIVVSLPLLSRSRRGAIGPVGAPDVERGECPEGARRPPGTTVE